MTTSDELGAHAEQARDGREKRTATAALLAAIRGGTVPDLSMFESLRNKRIDGTVIGTSRAGQGPDMQGQDSHRTPRTLDEHTARRDTTRED